MDQLRALIAAGKKKGSFNRGERAKQQSLVEEEERNLEIVAEAERVSKRIAELEALHESNKRFKFSARDKEEVHVEKVSEISRECTANEKLIITWIDKILNAWETSKEDVELLAQTRNQLKPLLHRLNLGTLQDDILTKLEEIVKSADALRYREAHDAYLLLAIGNAAWPLGVKGLINQRSEKVASAHILNDETTRMYMQSFKRLLSRSQKLFPAENPSDMVS